MLTINKYCQVLKFLFLLFAISTNAQDTYLKFDHISINNGLPQNSVYSIVKDKYGFMWFGTWGGVARYDGYSIKVFRAVENDMSSLPDNRINIIVIDSLQNIWVETGAPMVLCKYNFETENFSRVAIPKVSKSVIKLIKTAHSGIYKTINTPRYLFVRDNDGLHQISKQSRQQIVYSSDVSSPFSLSDKVITSMYLDDCDNLWVGTLNNGVNVANLHVNPFLYYYFKPQSAGLIENNVRAVCTDLSGKVWVGSDNGITVIERSLNADKYNWYKKEILRNSLIRSLYCDKYGLIWIGTKGGLDCFNSSTRKFKHYFIGMQNGLSDPNIYSILEDHQGTLWIGTFKGLIRYNRELDQFDCLNLQISGIRVRATIEDKHGNLWVGTEDGGLTKLERTKAAFKSTFYVHKDGNENTIINNRIFSLAEDNTGRIWIGTNCGLSLFEPRNSTFRHFTNKTGLPDDIIMGVLFDEKEAVWVSHKKGLSKVNIRNFETRNFNVFDGLQGNEFNQSVCFRDKTTGEMFFGGTNGLNSFFPDSIKTNLFKPKVVLTGLSVMLQEVHPGTRVNNRVILEKSLLCANEITLTWKENSFSLEFAALHFANPSENKYKYKLEGFDKQWIYSDASIRKTSYSNLPSGKYVFKVLAANSDGVWKDMPTSIDIKVLPPWWLTWWMLTIECLFIIVVIYLVYRIIYARKKYQNQIQSLHERFTKKAKTELTNVSVNITDDAFLKKLTQLVEENLSNEDFDFDMLADKLKMSRSQLNRKIKNITNSTLKDFTTTIRMKKAVEYLVSGNYNIAETAYKLGFSLPNNFTRAFIKHFGVTPSEYIESLKK